MVLQGLKVKTVFILKTLKKTLKGVWLFHIDHLPLKARNPLVMEQKTNKRRLFKIQFLLKII